MNWPKLRAKLKIAAALLGVIVGLSAGAGFFYLRATETASCALLSGLYALVLLVFFVKDFRVLRRLEGASLDLTSGDEESALLDGEGDAPEDEWSKVRMSAARDRQRATGDAGRGEDPLQRRPSVHGTTLVLERSESWSWWTFRWISFVMAAVGLSAGASGMIAYALLAHANGEFLNATSHWLTIVWSFMVLKWSLALFLETGPWTKRRDVEVI